MTITLDENFFFLLNFKIRRYPTAGIVVIWDFSPSKSEREKGRKNEIMQWSNPETGDERIMLK